MGQISLRVDTFELRSDKGEQANYGINDRESVLGRENVTIVEKDTREVRVA